jgi:hypothetical protein
VHRVSSDGHQPRGYDNDEAQRVGERTVEKSGEYQDEGDSEHRQDRPLGRGGWDCEAAVLRVRRGEPVAQSCRVRLAERGVSEDQESQGVRDPEDEGGERDCVGLKCNGAARA